jgi:glycerol-3-phosphate cytidylyltransferase
VKKYKRGLTMGVYDMFHIGHLNALLKEKELCEELVVGINTDELVQDYKNITPVVPFDERCRIVEALRCVDKVCPHTSRESKFKDVVNHNCDVLFIGEDHKGSDEWDENEKRLAGMGVAVEYIPYTEGTSSTKLRKVVDGLIEIIEKTSV